MLIRRSIIAFVVLFLLYAAVLPYTEVPGFRRGSPWELNMIAAEVYAYDQPEASVVIAGSSISYWLRDLPSDWYNLAQAGEGALTGLTVIDHAGARPKIVLVEINRIDKPVNSQMLAGLFTPGIQQAKQRLPLLQERNEPSHVTLRCIYLADYYATRIADLAGYDLTSRDTESADTQTAKTDDPDHSNTSDPAAGGNILRTLRLEAVKTGYEETLLTDRLQTLRGLVERLEKRGIHVILFEAPEDPATYDSVRRSQLRNLARTILPPERFAFLDTPLDQTYQTRDGVHMTAESATRYCHWLINNLPAPNTLVSASP